MGQVKDWLMDQQEKGNIPFPDDDKTDEIVYMSGYTEAELSCYSEKNKKENKS